MCSPRLLGKIFQSGKPRDRLSYFLMTGAAESVSDFRLSCQRNFSKNLNHRQSITLVLWGLMEGKEDQILIKELLSPEVLKGPKESQWGILAAQVGKESGVGGEWGVGTQTSRKPT